MGSDPRASLGSHGQVQVTTTRSMRVVSTHTRVADLRAFLEGARDDAQVTVRTESPDRPGESSMTTFTITTQEQP